MRTLALIGALMGATLLAGCNETENRGLTSIRQPVVQRTDYVIDLATTNEGLAPGEAVRLRGWYDSLHLAYGDRVAVDTSAAGGAQAAVNMVATITGARGLLLADHAPITQGQIMAGAVRVVLSRTHASVPNCPNFHQGLLARFDAATAPNYGCATNSNLAAMIANPEDLVKGRDESTRDGTISTNQINTASINTYYTKTGQQAGSTK